MMTAYTEAAPSEAPTARVKKSLHEIMTEIKDLKMGVAKQGEGERVYYHL